MVWVVLIFLTKERLLTSWIENHLVDIILEIILQLDDIAVVKSHVYKAIYPKGI